LDSYCTQNSRSVSLVADLNPSGQADDALPVNRFPSVHPGPPIARVLISDDSPDIQRIYTILLPHHGFDVIATPGGLGQATVHLCRQCVPDLVMTDVNKPDLSGYDVCQAIRSDPRTAHIPLLFVTAMDEMFDRRRGRAVGADDYIVKPFLAEGLLYRLVTLLALACDRPNCPVTLMHTIPGLTHQHPLTSLPGPQVLARMLPHLTQGTDWVALVVHVQGFDLLLRVYGRPVAESLLLKLVLQLRQLVHEQHNPDMFLAHPGYGWHIAIIGLRHTAQTLEGLYQLLQRYFASEVQKILRRTDRVRGYLVSTDLSGHEQRGAFPTLVAQQFDAQHGSISNLQTFWDVLDRSPWL